MSRSNLNKKIYLVSESPADLSKITSAIKKYGFRLIRDRNSGRGQLISRIRASHPDLIFWDGRSFSQDSLPLLQTLRENVETKSIPVYFFTPENGDVPDLPSGLDDFKKVSMLEPNLGKEKLGSLLSGILKPTVAIKFWGVRGSTPCANKENVRYGGNTTCVQVELPFSDKLLVLDSGTGIRNLGNYLVEFRNKVSGHIFITHPHWDHIQGFPFFKPIYDAENHFDIHMPPQVTGGCREILSGHLTKTFFPVTLDMFDANLEFITQQNNLKEYDGYSVEYMLANHPINTAVYKIRVAGKTIVFCPDNELKPMEEKTNAYFYKKLKEFFRNADILIHDAQYNLKSYRTKVEWGHSAWQTVVDFAQRSGVKNLFLTHHDPDSDDEYLEQLDEHIQQKFGHNFESVQLAKEGVKMHLEIPESISRG